MSDCALPEVKDLSSILQNPTSTGHVENLLDVIAALIWDCNFQSAKNSRAIQSFIQRFSDVANLIYSQRAKYTDFELVKVIGQGGFGRVQLVREKNTRRVYAMKMMSKQHLLDHSQSGYWEERDIMVKADSEWLVACHQAFVVSFLHMRDLCNHFLFLMSVYPAHVAPIITAYLFAHISPKILC
ncbi:unnamed protein product [Schistocephalus solidus]|uniref:Protein kinase domain-containing protein n=1 Tax=Schistocephalus solidus TaxID=70667 RepID=A0A183T6H2_SCHSO|nr:unnamed protein product [Schistocephalus solidus]